MYVKLRNEMYMQFKAKATGCKKGIGIRVSRSENGQVLSKQATNWFRGIAAIMIVLSHYAEWWTWFTPTEGNAEVIRLAISKLGPYGVSIFFLFSGYAMVKSLGQERMYPEFIWKRIKNVYLPYFIIVGIIELLSGGFSSVQDFWSFASGYDYWYMFVLFILYIGFIAIWTILGGRGLRVGTFVVFTWLISYMLYSKGMQDFWFISNIAFAIGVTVGEYEENAKGFIERAGIFTLIVLAMGMVFVVYTGLFPKTGVETGVDEWKLWKEVGAAAIWAILILIIASKWRIYNKGIMALGRSSLYVYLTHTYIFMRCVNNFNFSFAARFLISAIITVAVSLICNRLMIRLFHSPFRREESPSV